MDPDDPAYAGQVEYTRRFLAVYDPFVLGFMARVVWRCPTPPVVERYRRHVGRRHLEVGPGTGYFLDKAGLPATTEITVLDPNPDVLSHVARRLASRPVTTVEADVLKPLPVEGGFDSAGLNYVLHCLPGPQSRKAAAIRNVATTLAPEGTLFGGTVLGSAAPHTRAARAALRALNRRGGFDNLGDTEAGLRQLLEACFRTVEMERVGSVAQFTAVGPR